MNIGLFNSSSSDVIWIISDTFTRHGCTNNTTVIVMYVGLFDSSFRDIIWIINFALLHSLEVTSLSIIINKL